MFIIESKIFFFFASVIILYYYDLVLLSVVMQDRKPFAYRDKVTWSEVAGLLNGLFIFHTGRSLPKEQLDYLAIIALSQCQLT